MSAPTATRSRIRRAVVAVTLAVSTTGCLATRSDLQTLQLDIANTRRDVLRADSLREASLDTRFSALDRTLRALADSVSETGQRASRFEGDAREQLRAVREQLIQVQELTGQSQRRLQDLRASLDARSDAAAAPTRPAPSDTATNARVPAPHAGPATPPTTAPGTSPTAAELYRLSTDQLRRGSYGAARTGLTDLLRRFPDSELAPDAQYALAEAYAGERNAAAADSAYAEVTARYPTSPRAATALYKRARRRRDAGHRSEARALYEELVRRYPRADEATLAREALRAQSSSGAARD